MKPESYREFLLAQREREKRTIVQLKTELAEAFERLDHIETTLQQKEIV